MMSSVNPASLLVVFVFCSLVGSFLNVVIYRLPLERSVVFPPSACVNCGVPLKAWQNIPIFSYFALSGRCHYCSAHYSARYALLELVVASYGAWLFWFLGSLGWLFFHHFVLFCVCLAVFFTDLDHWIIPDELNLFGVVAGLAFSCFLPPWGDMGWVAAPWQNLVSALLGLLGGVMFFWAIQVVGMALAKQEAMGGGDVKFAAALGAFLGWQMAFLCFLLSFFLGAFIALPLVVFGRGRGKDPIPFGTFMALAAVMVSLEGPRLLRVLMDLPFYLAPAY